MMRRSKRVQLRVFHRWLGLVTGLLLVLLGLTGSLLVFHREIDHFVLNRDLWRAKAGPSPLTLAQMSVRLAEQRPAGRSFGVDRPYFQGSAPSGYYELTESNGETRFMIASLAPSTGMIRGEFAWGELPPNRRNLMTVVYRLHYELLAGDNGAVVVGVIGIATLLLVGIGTYLWWPAPGRWSRALTIKRRAPSVRRQFDLHGVFGATGSIVLAVIAFSGVYMVFPYQFHAAVAPFVRVAPFPKAPRLAEKRASIDPAQVEAVVRRRVDAAARYDSFGLGNTSTPHRVVFREPGDPRTDYGSTVIFADPANGQMLARSSPAQWSAADVFFRYQFTLHNGQALGLIGRVLIAIAGLLPLVLFVTGARLWWSRRVSAKRYNQSSIGAA